LTCSASMRTAGGKCCQPLFVWGQCPDSELLGHCFSPSGCPEVQVLRGACGIRFCFNARAKSRFLASLGMTISLLRRICDPGYKHHGRHLGAIPTVQTSCFLIADIWSLISPSEGGSDCRVCS